MNDELLRDKLKFIDKKIDEHDKRIDVIEQYQSEFKVEIKNLCQQIKSLTSSIKFLITLLITSLCSFFFFSIQHYIIK